MSLPGPSRPDSPPGAGDTDRIADGAASPGATGPPPAGARADLDFVARAARIAIVAALVFGGLGLAVYVLKAALTPLAAAFAIAYLLDPVIDRFEARRVPRSVAIFALLGLLGGGLAVLLLFVVPKLQQDLAALAAALPGYLERLQTTLVPELERRVGLEVPRNVEELVAAARGSFLPSILEGAQQVVAQGFGYLTGTVSALVGLLVIPILAYYLLVEFDDLLRRLGEWIPPRWRPWVQEKARTVDELVAGFVRGQLSVAGMLAVLYAVGFGAIGVDFALGVGLLAGAMALVPYLGNVVAVTTASLLCILEFGFDGHLVAVLGWYVVVQLLEGFVLTPRIVGGSVGLHPAVVIVALLIGGDLLGFLGLLIAVPAAASAKVFADEALAAYRRSSLFRGDPA